MILPIRLYGDPCLKTKAFDALEEDNLKELVDDMFETLDATKSGVGLAATQVGIPLRVFVLIHGDLRIGFINPIILSYGDEMLKEEEGCLSIPNVGVSIKRYNNIRVQYSVLDENGELIDKVEEFDGFIARIIQHEIDHLNGICITDKLNILQKKMVQSKLNLIINNKLPNLHYPILHFRKKDYEIKSDEIYQKYIN